MIGYSAVILAGGKSRRMGQNKAELGICGSTFAEYLADKLWNMGISDIMLSGYEGELKHTRSIPDIYAGRGPLSGIHSGLCSAANSKVFILAGDAPLIPVSFLNELAGAHKDPVTVASSNGRIQPLAGLYDKAAAKTCEVLLQSGRFPVLALLEKVGFGVLSFTGNELMIRGCNTPGEYEELIRLAGEYQDR